MKNTGNNTAIKIKSIIYLNHIDSLFFKNYFRIFVQFVFEIDNTPKMLNFNYYVYHVFISTSNEDKPTFSVLRFSLTDLQEGSVTFRTKKKIYHLAE
ncbi:hypothetical protein BpHYR1_022039 [Brachionus plicatilis]|uniref:Uncharacterized protein n=1 Tax=Brachionus plicatilis TaxID=10195 RepID=A0A3M7SBS4_BRAPC|nr:hypothetical protein BpHYR1_022039 [Brachionus plicatilis]